MKNFKHWLIQKLLKSSKILDIEKALRDKYHEGVEATEKKYEGKINVWWDPTARSYPQPQKIVNPHGRYFKARHLEFMSEPVRTNTDPLDPEKDFPPFLNSTPQEPTFLQAQAMLKADISEAPTARDIAPKFDPLNTDEYHAVVKLLHQKRQQERHAS